MGLLTNSQPLVPVYAVGALGVGLRVVRRWRGLAAVKSTGSREDYSLRDSWFLLEAKMEKQIRRPYRDWQPVKWIGFRALWGCPYWEFGFVVEMALEIQPVCIRLSLGPLCLICWIGRTE